MDSFDVSLDDIDFTESFDFVWLPDTDQGEEIDSRPPTAEPMDSLTRSVQEDIPEWQRITCERVRKEWKGVLVPPRMVQYRVGDSVMRRNKQIAHELGMYVDGVPLPCVHPLNRFLYWHKADFDKTDLSILHSTTKKRSREQSLYECIRSRGLHALNEQQNRFFTVGSMPLLSLRGALTVPCGITKDPIEGLPRAEQVMDRPAVDPYAHGGWRPYFVVEAMGPGVTPEHGFTMTADDVVKWTSSNKNCIFHYRRSFDYVSTEE
ncbi:hypothetical protein CYMTET_47332 [Cymbomonas tetramitiformis]|uniref:Uncharacterized protein n=1 Tax=Cymbomonas tetramitiformis TaxID=36881 RepID=A0AAE0BVP4_9CHLO|nr:hypothetical protein CYMTET_47332 [Cymbomonas tetramitiformis]